MHVLLVEDNPADVTLFREALKSVSPPVQLSVMRDGQRALAFVHRQEPYTQAASPDIIFIDLNMPCVSGVELLAALEQDPSLKFLPTLVFTTTAEPDTVARCYELGANAYLVKPLDVETYFAVVRAAVAFWNTCQFRRLANG